RATLTVPLSPVFSPHATTRGLTVPTPARTIVGSSDSGTPPIRGVNPEVAGRNRAQHGRSYFERMQSISSQSELAAGAVVAGVGSGSGAGVAVVATGAGFGALETLGALGRAGLRFEAVSVAGA